MFVHMCLDQTLLGSLDQPGLRFTTGRKGLSVYVFVCVCVCVCAFVCVSAFWLMTVDFDTMS